MLANERQSAQNILFGVAFSIEQLKNHSSFVKNVLFLCNLGSIFILVGPLFGGRLGDYDRLTMVPAACDLKPYVSTIGGVIFLLVIAVQNVILLFVYVHGLEPISWRREGWTPRAAMLKLLCSCHVLTVTVGYTGTLYQLLKSFMLCGRSEEDTRTSLVLVVMAAFVAIPSFLLSMLSGTQPSHNKYMDAQPLGRYKVVELILKGIVVVFASNPKLGAICDHRFVLLATVVLLLFMYNYFLCYYNNRANRLVSAILLSAALFFICSWNVLWLGEITGVGRVGAYLMVLTLTTVGGVLGYMLPHYVLTARSTYILENVRLNNENVAPFPFWFAHDVDVYTRWFYMSTNKSKEQADLVEGMYRYAMMEAPNNVFIQVMYNTFVLMHRQDLLATRKLRDGGSLGILNLDVEYRMYLLERQRVKLFEGHLAEGALSFRSDLSNCRSLHVQAATGLVRVYQSILNGKQDSVFLSSVVHSLENSVETATSAYETLMERFPSSGEVMKFYSKFCGSVKNDLFTMEHINELRHRKRTRSSNSKEDNNSVASSGSNVSESGDLSENESRSTNTGVSSSVGTTDTYVRRASNRSGVRNYALAKHNLEKTVSRVHYNLLVFNFLKAAVVICFFLFVISSSLGGSYHNSSEVYNFVHESGRRVKLSQSVVYNTRMFVLAGQRGNMKAMKRFQEKVRQESLALHLVHRDLYHSVLVNLNAEIRAFSHKPQFVVQEYVMGTPPMVRNQTLSLWDLGNDFVRRGLEISSLTETDVTNIEENSAFRFIIDNGPGPVFEAFEISNTMLKTHDISMDHFRSQMYFVGFAVSLWLMYRLVFQPSLTSVRDQKSEMYKVIFGLPKIVIAQIFKELKVHITSIKRHEIMAKGDENQDADKEKEDNEYFENVQENDRGGAQSKGVVPSDPDENDENNQPGDAATPTIVDSDSDEEVVGSLPLKHVKGPASYESDALRATVKCLFVVLFLVACMYAHSYYVFILSGSNVAGTITLGSQRSSYATRLKMLAVELAASETENLPGSAMRAAALRIIIQDYISQLGGVHRQLKFGNSEKDAGSPSTLSSGMNDLMYNIGCTATNVTNCDKTGKDIQAGYYGMDFLVSRYLDECYLLLKDTTESVSLSNSHLKTIKDLEESALGKKLDEASAMYATEAKVLMKSALNVQRAVFWILCVVIFGMFMFVLRPRYSSVYQDFRTNTQTLIYLPMSVWTKVPALQAYIDSGETRQNKKMNIDKLEKKLQSIMESVPDAVILSDDRGVITSCNSAVLNIFGYEPYDVIGKNVNILMPEPYAREHATYIRRYLATSSKRLIGQYRQLVGLDRQGRVFPIHLTIGESFVDKTRVFIATIKDISDIKIKEEKVHQTEVYLQSMLESAMNSIISCNESGEITLFNEKAEHTFGYKKSETIGMNVKMLMPPPYDQHHDEFIANYVKTGERKLLGIIRELTAKHKDGTVFPIEVALSEGITGESRIFTAIIQDISKKKDLEEAKLQAMESDTKTRVARQFLANMSHEIRTPLNGVIGMVELLLNSDLHGLQKQYATVVSNCSKALLALINDVLDVSKIEEGMMELVPEPFDFVETVETAVDVMSVQLMEKSMEGIVLLDPMVPLNVEGDANRIGQILRNLCGNAVKFTNSGHVMVRAKAVDSIEGVEVGEDEIILAMDVVDTGIGIHPNDQKKLFERFSQVDLSHKRQFEGSGLGLSISKELVELMGGRVSVKSVVNAGSTFSFYICLKRVDYIPAIDQLGVRDACANHSVLIVHEHKNVRDEISATLDKVVSSVRTCGLQRQAVSILAQAHNTDQAITCILLFLPETDTASLIGLPEAVASDRRFASTPIIVFVPFGKRDKMKLDKSLLRAIVNKPITQSKIWNALKMATPDNMGFIETATVRSKGSDPGSTSRRGAPSSPVNPAPVATPPQPQPAEPRQPPMTAPRMGARPEPVRPPPRNAETPNQPTRGGSGASSAQPLPAQHPGAANRAANKDPCYVLLVEDNKVNQMMASAMIEQLGHQCTIANNGLEALDLLEANDYDMVLMDIQMPGMDGYATTEVIREKEQQTGKHAPILAFTAHTSPDEQERALGCGMDDVITKPVTATALNEIIFKWRKRR